MRRRSTILAFALLLLGALPPSARAGWSPTGSGRLALDAAKSASSPSLAVIGGAPWVAWREDTGTGAYDVHVARWNGTAWTTVGGALNADTTRNAYLPQLVDFGGTPWVAWEETNGVAYQLRVKRWDGSAWSAVGGVLNVDTSKSASEPGMANVGGTPYVTWNEANGSNVTQVRVKRWDGSAWTSAGGSLNTNASEPAVNTQIADIGGTPYVTWEEWFGASSNQVHVKSWDGSAWNSVGGVVNVDPTKVTNSPMLTDVGGQPWIAWEEYNGSINQARVAHWTGSAWASAGVLNLDGTHHADEPSVADIGGTPYAVWEQETGNGGEVHVARWTGSAWSTIGDALNPGSTGYDPEPRLVVVGGVPYVAWVEAGLPIRQVRISSLAVDVLDEQSTATATGATLTASVRDFGMPLPVAFQYGAGGAFGSQTPTQTTAGTGTATVTASVGGLAPATSYSWRAVGLDPFGAIAPGAGASFTTLAAGTVGTAAPGAAPAPQPTPVGARTSIACKAGKPARGRAKVTCTVKLAAARSGKVRVALRRGSRTVATGAGRLTRGAAKLKLSAHKRVKPGRYTLVIKAGKATVSSSTVRIGR
jgi:hypothetical protein